MSNPLPATALRGLGEPKGTFLVVDPGGLCGLARVGVGWFDVDTCTLDELPGWLNAELHRFDGKPIYLVCEDYTLAGGRAGAVQAGSKMPSAQGIGMCRTACVWTDTTMFLVAPGSKRAGHQALDAIGRAAYQAAHNDHERDAVDIAGFVLREVRRAPVR